MTKQLTLGTAELTLRANGTVFVRYMNVGSFLVGERMCLDMTEACEFCRSRGIRVL